MKQVIKVGKSTIKGIYVKHNFVVWETGAKKNSTLVFTYDLKLQLQSKQGHHVIKGKSLLLCCLTEKLTLP